jgi:hypothetical protein
MNGGFLPIEGEEALLRDQFHRFANARENPHILAEAKEWLVGLLASTPAISSEEWCIEPSPIIGKSEWDFLPSPETADADLLAFHAPLGLLEGAWLQSVAVAGNTDSEPVNSLFACYLALLGKDDSCSPAFAYRGLLNQNRMSLPAATAWQFAHNPRISAAALHFANLQLALGLHSAALLPETVGFTLAYVQSPSPWRLPALNSDHRDAILVNVGAQVNHALLAFSEDAESHNRISKGFALHKTFEAHYRNKLRAFYQRLRPKAEEVAQMIRRKLPFARGYHAKVKLGGRGLEEWFADTPFDMLGFLKAFSVSSFAQGNKGNRPFDRLTRFGGPMFGVFDNEEMELIDAWLDETLANHGTPQLNAYGTDGLKQPDTATSKSLATRVYTHSRQADQGFDEEDCHGLKLTMAFLGRIDKRKLFHRLVNQDFQPSTLNLARQRVERVLAQTRLSWFGGNPNQRFFSYDPNVFTQRIKQIHDTEISKYKPLRGSPSLRREELIWVIRQLAPAILVDGCWLQHIGNPATQDQRKSRLLQRIYAEELGDGRADWNHPKIYRDLLNDLAIDLPNIASRDFAEEPSLLNSSFDLPSYLLAISQFPRTYLPELLGLNLAIELSGLGAGYLRLAEEFGYWKINPLIVNLHLSIDNLAGGHAAMACEAIQLHMDEVLSLAGADMGNKTWRRIWTGYRSLNCATGWFKLALITGFLRHFMPQRLLSFTKNDYNSI